MDLAVTVAAGLAKSVPEVKAVAVLLSWHDTVALETPATVLFSEHPDRVNMLLSMLDRVSAFQHAISEQLKEAIRKERLAHAHTNTSPGRPA